MRKLSFLALQNMNNQTVIVHDLSYDAYDQICTVHLQKNYKQINKNGKKIFVPIIDKIILSNEEFTFIYENGICKNGDFEVYTFK